MEEHAPFPADGTDLGHGPDHPGFVVRPHEGDQGGVRPDRGLERVEIKSPVFVHSQQLHLVALGGEKLQRRQHRTVLDLRGNDVLLAGITPDRAHDGGVVAFGAAAVQDDPARMAAEQPGHLLPGQIQTPPGSFAETVGAGRVAEPFGQIGGHTLTHLRGQRGGSVVVEVDGLHG